MKKMLVAWSTIYFSLILIAFLLCGCSYKVILPDGTQKSYSLMQLLATEKKTDAKATTIIGVKYLLPGGMGEIMIGYGSDKAASVPTLKEGQKVPSVEVGSSVATDKGKIIDDKIRVK